MALNIVKLIARVVRLVRSDRDRLRNERWMRMLLVLLLLVMVMLLLLLAHVPAGFDGDG